VTAFKKLSPVKIHLRSPGFYRGIFFAWKKERRPYRLTGERIFFVKLCVFVGIFLPQRHKGKTTEHTEKNIQKITDSFLSPFAWVRVTRTGLK